MGTRRRRRWRRLSDKMSYGQEEDYAASVVGGNSDGGPRPPQSNNASCHHAHLGFANGSLMISTPVILRLANRLSVPYGGSVTPARLALGSPVSAKLTTMSCNARATSASTFGAPLEGPL